MAAVLKIHERPKMRNPSMLIGLSGWMNGGDVATGAVEYLVEKLDAVMFAEVDSSDFYVLNMPGVTEFSPRSRPMIVVDEGTVREVDVPENIFYYSAEHNIILFHGSEPNMKWDLYSNSVLDLAEKFNVSMIYSIGSVGGAIPHTRQPRLEVTVSDDKLKSGLQQLGILLLNYAGPGGVSSYMIREAARRKIQMANLVAEIPPYVHGRNDMCIEFMVKVLCGLLLFYVEHDDLKRMGDRLEQKINNALSDYPELVERIKDLEDSYDREVFDLNMDEMKQWLTERGIRLD